MTEYGKGWGTQSPPLQSAVDTEQIRNLQDSERYAIHVSGTKIDYVGIQGSLVVFQLPSPVIIFPWLQVAGQKIVLYIFTLITYQINIGSLQSIFMK